MIPRTIAVSVALAAVAAVPALWAADSSTASKPPTPTTEAASPSTNATPKLITFDFPGGTVAELLTGTGFSSNASVYVINPNGISVTGAKVINEPSVDTTTVVPPFSVRNATPDDLVRAFNAAMAPYGLRLITNGTSFLLMMSKRPDQPSRPSFFNSYQLNPYLEQQSIDDIVDAIQTAWALDPAIKAASPQLKYHPATSILFVYGSPEALGTAQQVIYSLKHGPDAATDSAPSSAAERTRQQKVSDEVLRRRELRQQNSPAQKSAGPLNPPPDPEKK